jgi:hypothetical protein
VWHASAAVHELGWPPLNLKPVSHWTQREMRIAREALAKATFAVGRDDGQIYEETERSIQTRRLVSPDEQLVVGPSRDDRPPGY